MRRIRGRDTSPELHFRRALWASGLRGYRLNVRSLPGAPDIVYRRAGVAVFVDGCFWHGCPKCYRRPASNQDYWDAKLARNKARDAAQRRKLRRDGWSVLRIWEHELKQGPEACVTRVARALGATA